MAAKKSKKFVNGPTGKSKKAPAKKVAAKGNGAFKKTKHG